MPRYAYITVRGSTEDPYIVRSEDGAIIAQCPDRDTASRIRDEYDAHRNVSTPSYSS